MSNLPSASEREAFIRQYAASIGIDPDVAVTVARSEGLGDGIWQGRSKLRYGQEQSYGDFQLHDPPPNSGYSPGLGSEFKAKTGLDPKDPANWKAMNMFALDTAKTRGWGDWMGASAKGITGKMGIGNAPVPQPSMGTSMGNFAEGPTAVADRQAKLSDTKPAENSATPDMLEPEPAFPAPAQASPSKSPQDIYGEYLKALSAISSRPRQPYSLNLQTFDTVIYE